MCAVFVACFPWMLGRVFAATQPSPCPSHVKVIKLLIDVVDAGIVLVIVR